MYMYKKNTIKKVSKKSRTTMKRRSQKKSKRGGGCGCKMNGGSNEPPSFSNLPIRYFYSENTHQHDPLNPNTIVSSRTLPNIKGGKKSKKSYKHMKGGDFMGKTSDALLGSQLSLNPVGSIGSVSGSMISSNLLSGTPNIENPALTVQPVNDIYNSANPQLA